MKPSLAEVTIWLVMISSCCPIQLNFPQTSVLVQPQATSHAVSLVSHFSYLSVCGSCSTAGIQLSPLSYKLSFSWMRGM